MTQKIKEKDKFSDIFGLFTEFFLNSKFIRSHRLSDKSEKIFHHTISIILMAIAYQWGLWIYFYASFQKFFPLDIPNLPPSKILSVNTPGTFLISQFSGAFSFSIQTIERWIALLYSSWLILGITEFSVGLFIILSIITGEWLPNRRKYFMIIAASCGVLVNGWLMAGDAIPNWSLFANTNGNNMDTDVIYFSLAVLILIFSWVMDYRVRKQKEKKYMAGE